MFSIKSYKEQKNREECTFYNIENKEFTKIFSKEVISYNKIPMFLYKDIYFYLKPEIPSTIEELKNNIVDGNMENKDLELLLQTLQAEDNNGYKGFSCYEAMKDMWDSMNYECQMFC